MHENGAIINDDDDYIGAKSCTCVIILPPRSTWRLDVEEGDLKRESLLEDSRETRGKRTR